jgi:hypothetical protein
MRLPGFGGGTLARMSTHPDEYVRAVAAVLPPRAVITKRRLEHALLDQHEPGAIRAATRPHGAIILL